AGLAHVTARPLQDESGRAQHRRQGVADYEHALGTRTRSSTIRVVAPLRADDPLGSLLAPILRRLSGLEPSRLVPQSGRLSRRISGTGNFRNRSTGSAPYWNP